MVLRRVDFQQYGIVIKPESTDPKEEVCIDLHVGSSLMVAGNSTSYPIYKPHKLTQGACIIVRTKEHITLPNNVIGTLCAKGSLAALGFLVPNTKIDPMFSGYLDIALFNGGTRILDVELGSAFCSVIFHQLPGAIQRSEPRLGIQVIELEQEPRVKRRATAREHIRRKR
jgi:deoxycytidine triphosphate deaminase